MLEFKIYDLNNDLDFFNKILYKASQDRYELRLSKNNKYYLYDYDFREITRNKEEIKDIITCQNMQEYTYDEDKQRLINIMKEVGIYE